jgi:hypothetical protein
LILKKKLNMMKKRKNLEVKNIKEKRKVVKKLVKQMIIIFLKKIKK